MKKVSQTRYGRHMTTLKDINNLKSDNYHGRHRQGTGIFV